MGKSRRSLAVVELEQMSVNGQYTYTATISIPGRDGVFERAWDGTPGHLDVGAVSDLAQWVALTVQNTIICAWGAQGSLLGDA